MSWLQTIVLAFVQGVTEFLPVSSSAHLIIFPELFDWPDQGLAFDVAVHFGSLVAVCHYFKIEIIQLISAWLKNITQRKRSQYSQLAWIIIFATIPIVVAALFFGDWVEQSLRSPIVIGVSSIVFGVLLWLADKFFSQSRELNDLKISDAWMIGIAQVLAMIPGTSRSGITMTAARGLGFNRETAAKFSFLLAIPTIFLAFLWQTMKVVGSESVDVDFPKLIIGSLISAVIAWLTIHSFLAWIRRTDMTVFVVYRICLGLILLGIFL